MVTVAQDLFGGGRVLRWTLLAVSLLALPAFVSPLPGETTAGTVVRFGVIAALALLALAMLAPRRFHWAGRAVCGIVFVAYAAYIVSEYLAPSGPSLTTRRSAASLGNALCGMVVIGLPALVYALRSPRRREPFELRFAVEMPAVELADGPSAGTSDRWLVDHLATRLAEDSWRVDGPDLVDGTWTLRVERDGFQTVVETEVEHERIEDVSLDFWHLSLRRPGRTDWREDPLAKLVEEICDDLAGDASA